MTKKAIIASLIIGIILILLSVPLFFPLELLICQNCREVGCALCGLCAATLSFLLLIFGIILTVISAINLKKSKTSNYNVALAALRWFLIIISVILCVTLTYYSITWLKGNYSNDVKTSNVIELSLGALIMLCIAIALIIWDKKIRHKK